MEYPYMLDSCGMIDESLEECDVFYYPNVVDLSQNNYDTLEGMRLQILNTNLRNNYSL